MTDINLDELTGRFTHVRLTLGERRQIKRFFDWFLNVEREPTEGEFESKFCKLDVTLRPIAFTVMEELCELPTSERVRWQRENDTLVMRVPS